MRLTVDGEVFDARERADEPGVYDLTWESGLTPGPVLTIANNTRSTISAEVMTDVIRDFLADVDPETGRIE